MSRKSSINIFLILIQSVVLCFSSCSANFFSSDRICDKVGDEIRFELDILSSETELDSFIQEDDMVVDWKLARKFSAYWLIHIIRDGEYPVNSCISDIPVPIYDNLGKIKFYEFGIISDENIVGYILASARKNYSTPILYHSNNNDKYTNVQKILNGYDCKIRIVDNGYPNIVYGILDNSNNFKSFYSLSDLSEIAQSDIKQEIAFETIVIPGTTLKVKALTENENESASFFWNYAERNLLTDDYENKTSLVSKNRNKESRTLLDKDKIYEAFHVNGNYWHVSNYGACAAVSTGFILDYLQVNFRVNSQWVNMRDFDTKKNSLYKLMYIGESLVAGVVNVLGESGDAVTLPTDLGGSVSYFSNYKLQVSSDPLARKSINNNLPGISLRIGLDAVMHYRNIIGYREIGWGPFKWGEIKILDLVDSENLREGSWEVYRPSYQLATWNLVHK